MSGTLRKSIRPSAPSSSRAKRTTLKPIIQKNVEAGANVYTDELASYTGLSPEYVHGVINHAECYVKGTIHTNGMENYWSLFKRCVKGTHVSIEPFHLFRYLNAEGFRFNHRELTDGGRFLTLIPGVVGKRLTYKSLIGENPEGRLASGQRRGKRGSIDMSGQ